MGAGLATHAAECLTVAETAEVRLRPGDGLLLIHLQYDFLPGGSLAVAAGEEVIAPLQRWIERFVAAGLPVVATRDWHPPDHCSFRAQGGPWPPHCIAGTPGAQYTAALQLPPGTAIVSQATQSDAEAYSGFDDSELHQRLQELGVRRLFVGGLATDYCVLNTVLDALKLAYRVVVLTDCVRPVEVHPGDGERALAAMRAAGALSLAG